MEREEKPRGNTVLLTIIAVATLLVAVIGATFAYFSATITGNDSPSTSVIVKTATLGIVYNSGQQINLANATPSQTAYKDITIENDGEIALEYNLNWNIAKYEFEDATSQQIAEGIQGMRSDFVYKVEQSTDGGSTYTTIAKAETTLPSVSGKIFDNNVSVAAGVTHHYRITVTFKNTGLNQNNNQNKAFEGSIVVTSPNVSQ